MILAILGRQPAIGAAELERKYGRDDVTWFSDQAVTVEAKAFDIQRLGGTTKAGVVSLKIDKADWQATSQKIVQHYLRRWSSFEGKLTLGISAYGFPADGHNVQKAGIILKQKLKKNGVSVRLVPNSNAALNTAVSHHNKLGLSDNKVELLVVRSRNGRVLVAESTGAQNITAYAKRDQERPKRDAFVGMLPPKLAQIMINLAITQKSDASTQTILDPFCGTGVILQEAALNGYRVYGTDLSEKMIHYSDNNLTWLQNEQRERYDWNLHEGDAMDTAWQQPISAVVAETYLGQPFSAAPSPTKLEQVRGNCNHIITTFLENIIPQLESGAPLCLAVPAWRDANGAFIQLPLVTKLESFGVKQIELKTARPDDLLYARPDQIVARQLLLLEKS